MINDISNDGAKEFCHNSDSYCPVSLTSKSKLLLHLITVVAKATEWAIASAPAQSTNVLVVFGRFIVDNKKFEVIMRKADDKVSSRTGRDTRENQHLKI